MNTIDELFAWFRLPFDPKVQRPPMPKAWEFAQQSGQHATQLAEAILAELSNDCRATTALCEALAFVPEDDWPRFIEPAVRNYGLEETLTGDDVLTGASLQFVRLLHPHRQSLMQRADSETEFRSASAWRESNPSEAAPLLEWLDDPKSKPWQRDYAWRALLETRHPDLLLEAAKRLQKVRVKHASFAAGEVGFDLTGQKVRPLYPTRARHFHFANQAEMPTVHPQFHPTWQRPTQPTGVDFPAAKVGGEGTTTCGRCNQNLSRIDYFDTTAPLPTVQSVNQLSLETCTSCLGWSKELLFYHHDQAGMPKSRSWKAWRSPESRRQVIAETTAELVDHGDRWQFQDVGYSNSRENLHRLGGHPTWVQSAGYPPCPQCHRLMPFLMQLDSCMLDAEGEGTFWLGEGMLYVFWCDECRVSAMTAQDT